MHTLNTESLLDHADEAIAELESQKRKAAAAGGGGITMDTRASAGNYWVPRATSVAVTGEVANVDNRRQVITVSSTTSVAPGDAFTIANCEALHHITKGSTGNLKTFRVISVPSGTTLPTVAGTRVMISPSSSLTMVSTDFT